jgi:hypothetical protein
MRKWMVVSGFAALAIFTVIGLQADGPAVGRSVSDAQARLVTGGDILPIDEYAIARHGSAVGATKSKVCATSTYCGCGGGACSEVEVNNLSGSGQRGMSKAGYCSEKICNSGSATCGAPKYEDCQ